MLNVRIAAAFVFGATLSPCALQAQITVLEGSSLPTDQGWSVQTNVAVPDITTDGTTITVNTIGTPQGASARLLFYKNVGAIGGRFWVEFRIKLNELGAVHNTSDAGLAVFANFHSESMGGSASDRGRMIYLDPSQVGWGNGDVVPADTMSDFHDYRLEYDDDGSGDAFLRLFINGILRLSDLASNVPTGTIAFGDMTQDANLNSTYQIEWVRVFRDCNRNNVEDGDEIASGSPDCNGNDQLDECEPPSFDCNGNGLHDACDIQSGFSLDGNGDGFPDECLMYIVPNAVTSDPTGINKARFISFVPPSPPDGDLATSALRIRLVSLHHVDPPYAGGPTVPFTLFEGRSVWVGEPSIYLEDYSDKGGGPEYYSSFTQCTPLYRDWSTVGLLHVTGAQIVPSSVYHVENVSRYCQGMENSCSLVSAPLEMQTARWGDVWELYNPPSDTVQPDFADINAMLNKFRDAPGALIKVRAVLAGAPGNPWGKVAASVLSVDLGFAQISAAVNAFRGVPYPYKTGKCANNAACTTDAECSTNGPCELYCPD